MTFKKLLFASTAVLVLFSCSSNQKNNDSNTISGDVEKTQVLDTVGLQGEWKLDSYRLDCESMVFDSSSTYKMSINELDNTFSVTTDCNSIIGNFGITNDTIKFNALAVTEKACDKMTVEENMLRLLNDTTSFAICCGDTIFYTAPYIGNAVFVKLEKQINSDNE